MSLLAERFTILAPLRHRPYRTLFGGQVVSNIGDWLDILALIALLLYRWDLGAGAWGAVLTALTLPYALLGPVAGVWVDRWNQRTVMVVCDLARAGLALGLVWAPNLASVLILVTASSMFSTFHLPAQQAMIRYTVPDDDLMAANALGQLSDNGARLIGPALGGLAVVIGGPRFAFILNALTFVVSAAILSRLPATGRSAPSGERARRFTDDLRAGIQHILRSRGLLIGVGGMVVASFLIRSTDTLGAIVLKALGISEGMQGLSSTALGVGYVGGTLLVGQWGQRFQPLAIFSGGTMLVGSMLAVTGTAAILEFSGISMIVVVAFIGRMLIGAGFATMAESYGFILQRDTPAEMVGRVTATSRSVVAGVPLVAPLLATLLADRWGLGTAYTTFGLAMVVVGVAVMLVRPRNRSESLGVDSVGRGA